MTIGQLIATTSNIVNLSKKGLNQAKTRAAISVNSRRVGAELA